MMGDLPKKDGSITIRLDSNLLSQYKSLCEKNGYDMSKRLRLFIEAEIRFDEKGENIISRL
jgi:antitoxin component of RelBE/YafQ-DinJ toxin-antitoxin module